MYENYPYCPGLDYFAKHFAWMDHMESGPIKPKTDQQIFDHLVRHVVKYGVPCFKLLEDGELQEVSFNMSGVTSPLLAFFNPTDLAFLRKLMGYEALQSLSALDLRNHPLLESGYQYQCWRESPESTKEHHDKFFELLYSKGLKTQEKVEALFGFCNFYGQWLSLVVDNGGNPLTETKFENPSYVKASLKRFLRDVHSTKHFRHTDDLVIKQF